MTVQTILEQCDEIERLDEKASAAPWNCVKFSVEDNNFIMASRTFTPASAKALKMAIRALGVYSRMGYPGAKDALQQITESFHE